MTTVQTADAATPTPTGTWVWRVGYNSLSFLRGRYGEPVTPEHRHPKAHPGPYATWEDAAAAMFGIFGLFLDAVDADPDHETYHPGTRGQVEALVSDLAHQEPGTEWRHRYANQHAFWIEAEARCASGHNVNYHRDGTGDCAARPDAASPTTCTCLCYTA